MLRSVVVNRFGPVDVDSLVNFGKLWRPLGKPGLDGHDSTTMSQSVISTDSMISFRLKIDHHGRTTSIFRALRNGRWPGSSPSMMTSSTTKTPGVSFADSRPMCSGRFM